jgi:uncharacterized protein
MFLDLSRLEDGRLTARFEIDRASLVLSGFEGEIPEPLILDVEVRESSGGTYLLTGRLLGSAVAPCRRCLMPTAIPLDVPLRVVYQEPGRDARGSKEPGDDDIVWLDRGAKRIELDDQVRDRLLVETERFPLCVPECKGICPRCGQNLNEESCDCSFDTVDTRWKALDGLRLGEEGD